MECLLCYFKLDEQTLRVHYEVVHNVDPTNPYFKNLFETVVDSADSKCGYCGREFLTLQEQINHIFLRYYCHLSLQVGGSGRTITGHLNILRRDKILEFSINFDQHRDHYNFFVSDIVPRFLGVVYKNFIPETNTQYKFHGFFELLNWKSTPNEAYRTPSSWFTNVYRFSTFNRFVRQKMREEMQNRIINNGHSGSSWHFFRFQSLKVIVTPLKYVQDLLRG